MDSCLLPTEADFRMGAELKKLFVVTAIITALLLAAANKTIFGQQAEQQIALPEEKK
jgi:hypothetical protein